jgi:hypothetical protein
MEEIKLSKEEFIFLMHELEKEPQYKENLVNLRRKLLNFEKEE